MAFIGLEDRFESKVAQLYDKSARNSGTKTPNDEPFVEISPRDPNARQTANDTRMLPVGSVIRDFTRMSKYLQTGDGLRFLAKEAILQSGNAFSETRIYNPLFIISNIQPYVHFRRTLSAPSDFPVNEETRSPASTPEIGRAGRLQKNTSDDALARVVGRSGPSSLLSLLPASEIVRAVSSVFSVARGGSTGPDERPEFNVQDNLYSVAMWKRFSKPQSPASGLKAAAANLRVGNVSTAWSNVTKAATDFLRGIRPGGGLGELSAPQGRDNILDTSLAGRRFFITDKATGADRYLKGSIGENPSAPATVTYLDHRIRPIAGASPSIPAQSTSDDTNRTTVSRALSSVADSPKAGGIFKSLSTLAKSTQATADSVQRAVTKEAQNVARAVNSSIRNAIPDASSILDNKLKLPTIAPSSAGSTNENPAQDKMLFPELSLKHLYETSDIVSDVKSILDDQQKNQFAYWDQNKVNRGFVGGLKAGAPAVIDSNTRNSAPAYLKDSFNSVSIFTDNRAPVVSDATLKAIKDKLGQDLISVIFYDFVNRSTIPFRAYVSNVSETVMPEISDTRYIGRIDRNVVYVGVSREISFQLRVHALSESELSVIWRKISYMTGLCYPSRYDEHGFMIPPFVKLTLGDVWRDQPGYIKSLSHTVEDGTSWEILEDNQAPHGILINVTFAILEKTQVDSGAMFYPVGVSRSSAQSAPFVGQLSDGDKKKLGTTEQRPLPDSTTTLPTNGSKPVITADVLTTTVAKRNPFSVGAIKLP